MDVLIDVATAIVAMQYALAWKHRELLQPTK